DVVVDLYAVEGVVHRLGRGGRIVTRHLDARRHPTPRVASPPLHPRDAVVAGHVEQVDVVVDAPRDRDEPSAVHGALRVAVTSWLMPPDRSRRSTCSNPAAASWSSITAGGGRYATDFGR